jgi:hypothetical protein
MTTLPDDVQRGPDVKYEEPYTGLAGGMALPQAPLLTGLLMPPPAAAAGAGASAGGDPGAAAAEQEAVTAAAATEFMSSLNMGPGTGSKSSQQEQHHPSPAAGAGTAASQARPAEPHVHSMQQGTAAAGGADGAGSSSRQERVQLDGALQMVAAGGGGKASKHKVRPELCSCKQFACCVGVCQQPCHLQGPSAVRITSAASAALHARILPLNSAGQAQLCLCLILMALCAQDGPVTRRANGPLLQQYFDAARGLKIMHEVRH